MENLLEIFKSVKSNFCELTTYKLRNESIEIITPFSTIENKFVSVFIKISKGKIIVSDGGWIDLEYYNEIKNEEHQDITERVISYYLNNYNISTTANNSGTLYYFKICSNKNEISSAVFDLANFIVGAVNASSIKYKDGKEDKEKETFRKDANTFLTTNYHDRVKLRKPLDDFANIRFSAIISNGNELNLISYITGSTPFYFENALSKTIVNYEISEKSKYNTHIKEQTSAKKGKQGKKKVEVTIDKDKIYNRLVKITRLSDDEYGGMFSPDSKSIYYSATNPATNSRSFYKVKLEGGRPKEIKGTSNIGGFAEINGKFYYTSRGRLSELNPKTDRATSLPHSAKYATNFRAMNEQVFEEGTRVLTMGFYDPNFHGYDWKGLIKKYKPLALKASTAQDYSFIFNLMLGQLNASHMGYRSGTPERRNSDNIGLLGLEVKNTKDGAEIIYVLNGAAADKSKIGLKKGDVITAINNKSITSNTNFYSLLKNTRGDEILVSLKDGKDVVVRTNSSLRTLQYEAWVEGRKKLVNKFSNGQLGYIHIQGMNAPSFERFERELKASGYGKKGIVIDVRYNGGGWTTDRLMAVLNVYQHAYTVPRGAAKNLEKENKKFTKNYPFNERAILSVNTKPTVALCNEYSYSNAEIFSHAYKNLGLGKLVGQPTFGAVISTGGYGLMQGFVRMPFRAWYVAKSGKNMENEEPATPDYLVKNAPGSDARGEDEQLKKAVEVLLQDLK